MNLLESIGKKAANLISGKRSRYGLSCVGVAVVYALAKLYVASTPSPHDDAIPDQVKDMLLAYQETDETDS